MSLWSGCMKAYLNEHSVEFGEKASIKQINQEMELIDNFLNNYETLNDIEKYKLLTHFYSFYIEDEDFVELINIKNNTNFNKIISIPTKMEYFYVKQEGCGKNSSLHKEKYEVNLLCVTNDSFVLKTPKYSYDKIMELIITNQIYPILKEDIEINRFSKFKEDYTPIDCLIPDQIYLEREVWEDNYRFLATEENIPIIIKLIENTITYLEFLEDIKQYILKLINDFKYYEFICHQEEMEIKPILIKFYKDRFNKKQEF